MISRWPLGVAVAVLALIWHDPVRADDPVRVGYQLIYNPWKTAIASGSFQDATGREIRFVKFDSGAKALVDLAAGRLDIAVAGSSPVAAGLSRGIAMELFWIVADIAEAEALVVRQGSGVDPAKPETLRGKRIGVPFISTSHFQLLAALEGWGLKAGEVFLQNMQPNQIAAAWQRGDLDAAFVWNPALGRIKESGKVMITSSDLAKDGKATFDGMVVMRAFAEANPDFMVAFVKVMAEADAAYRDRKADWTATSEPVGLIIDLVGGDARDVPDVLRLYRFLTLEEQASEAWLGGGAAKALEATARFLEEQGQIDAVLTDYDQAVTARYVEAAMQDQGGLGLRAKEKDPGWPAAHRAAPGLAP